VGKLREWCNTSAVQLRFRAEEYCTFTREVRDTRKHDALATRTPLIVPSPCSCSLGAFGPLAQESALSGVFQARSAREEAWANGGNDDLRPVGCIFICTSQTVRPVGGLPHDRRVMGLPPVPGDTGVDLDLDNLRYPPIEEVCSQATLLPGENPYVASLRKFREQSLPQRDWAGGPSLAARLATRNTGSLAMLASTLNEVPAHKCGSFTFCGCRELDTHHGELVRSQWDSDSWVDEAGIVSRRIVSI